MTPGRSASLRWGGRVAVLLAVAALYALVVHLFASSTRLDITNAPPVEDPPRNQVLVFVEIKSVDATAGTAAAAVRVIPGLDLLDPRTASLKRAVTLSLFTSFDDVEGAPDRRIDVDAADLTFKPGASVLALNGTVTIPLAGDYQNYPFDSFGSLVVTSATAGADQNVPTQLTILGDVPGWLIRAAPLAEDAMDADATGEAAAAEAEVPERSLLRLSLVRAGSTKTFVILLLSAMLVLGACSLLVARAVVSRRRRIEATMASWFAAMLFAVIPLRLNMPGAPPIGVWIDFLVLLWVELALMLGLAVFIGSWLRFTPAPDRPAATDNPATPAPARQP